MAETRLLRIGEFSTLTRLSVRMLRYYDAHGVLSPARTSAVTGHRLYGPHQVVQANLIRQLRDVGFSVSAIAALLPLRDNPDALGRALAVQRDQLIADAEAARRRIAEIDHLISRIRRTIMADITITTHPAQKVVALRRKIDTYQDEGLAWEQFMAAVMEQGIPILEAPCGATFYDQEYREADVDIEVWQPVPDDARATEPLTVRDLPAQKVAVATFGGDYSQFGGQIAVLGEYVAGAGLEISGLMYNRYLVGPAHTQDPAQYLTEICMPVS